MLNIGEVLFLISVMMVSILIGIYLGARYSPKKTHIKTIKASVQNNEDYNNGTISETMLQAMKELKGEINADFIGLAIYEVISDEIRWRLAVGATNHRYKRIVIRMGKGIAGEVVQLNRTIKIENFPHDVQGNPIEYPILLVEHLKSVMAIPISKGQRIYGVLLVGQRMQRNFSDIELNKTDSVAQKIAEQLAEANIYTKVVHKRLEEKEDSQPINKSNESVFVQFLMEKKDKISKQGIGDFNFEILDQLVMELPLATQEILIDSVEKIVEKAIIYREDKLSISIAREEANLLVESTTNRSIPFAKETFHDIYERIGQIGGSIVSYHETDALHFIMQIPVWSYRNPI